MCTDRDPAEIAAAISNSRQSGPTDVDENHQRLRDVAEEAGFLAVGESSCDWHRTDQTAGDPIRLSLQLRNGTETVLEHRLAIEQQINPAQAQLLLIANHAISLVRAAVLPAEQNLRCWQSSWAGLPDRRQLDDAIAAIAVAQTLTDAEFTMLRDPSCAARYRQIVGT